jgi:hypothetical protein
MLGQMPSDLLTIHSKTAGDRYMITLDIGLSKALSFAMLALLCFAVISTQHCLAQGNVSAAPSAATLRDADSAEAAAGAGTNDSAARSGSAPATLDPEISPAVAKQLAAMQAEIEELKAELKRSVGGPTAVAAASPESAPSSAPKLAEPISSGTTVDAAAQSRAGLPAKPAPTQPFAYADWTWLNGNARTKDLVWDSKFFTPEIRLDAHYIMDLNHPRDDSMGGSTEIFRSNELQVEQISFGGNFHWQNVNARILTMNGMFGVTTPRNDASAGRGQWDLRGAYKYVSEANAGYHWDVNHGLNLDAGIFVSYIGLFSYYNFDNWTYQPSYVSSNTPWFFNGLRIQWFPTDKLKIEPWIINGWQSYSRLGSKPGLGGQILYRPKPWLSLVFNNYGMGEDTLARQWRRPFWPLSHPHRRQR